MEEIKILICGSAGVGKTALASRFTMDLFPEEFKPEIMHSELRRKFELDGVPVALEIHHYIPPEDWNTRDLTMLRCDGFIIMYSIIEQATLFEVTGLMDAIIRAKDKEDIPMILVGNKHDLCNDGVYTDSKNNMRVITTQQGQLVAKLRKCSFYEISAKTKYNVNDLFTELIGRIIKERKERYQKKKHDRSCRMH